MDHISFDIFWYISTFLSPWDLFRCRRVCLHLHAFTNTYIPHAQLFHEAQLFSLQLRLGLQMQQRIASFDQVFLCNGRQDIAFMTSHRRARKEISTPGGMTWACERGYLSLVKWLVRSRPAICTVSNISSGFTEACLFGHTPLAQWLARTFPYVQQTHNYTAAQIFSYVCGNGHLQMAQWLSQVFKITREDARSDNNYALLQVCKQGYLSAAQWLAKTFNLSRADAQTNNNFCLRAACENGHRSVVEWLVSYFKLTNDDVQADSCAALHLSCEYGHLELAQWLVQRFSLTVNEIRKKNNYALTHACVNYHLPIVQWLALTFQLTPTDFQLHNRFTSLFIVSCGRGNLIAAAWIASYFNFTISDARAFDNEAFVQAYSNKHYDVAQWLVETFDLSENDVLSVTRAVRLTPAKRTALLDGSLRRKSKALTNNRRS